MKRQSRILLFLLFCACAMAASGRSLYYSWTDMHKYNGTMTVMARVMQNGSLLADCELAAFDANGELRGSALSHPNDGGIIYLTIQGDNKGAELHFRVVHGSDDENRIITDANETIVFVADQTMGTYSAPQLFTITTALPGDVNLDGNIDSGDIMAVYNAMAGNADAQLLQRADVNGDSNIDSGDVMVVYSIMAGN